MAPIRFTMPHCASMRFHMLQYALMCFNMPSHASICFNMPRYASIRLNMGWTTDQAQGKWSGTQWGQLKWYRGCCTTSVALQVIWYIMVWSSLIYSAVKACSSKVAHFIPDHLNTRGASHSVVRQVYGRTKNWRAIFDIPQKSSSGSVNSLTAQFHAQAIIFCWWDRESDTSLSQFVWKKNAR